jgi:8-oxo-dGTP pyrophosphatase MutT (NUDIX family)
LETKKATGAAIPSDPQALKRRIALRFGGTKAAGRAARWSDYDLNPHALDRRIAPGLLREAAVLMPLVDRRPELTILFTRRTLHLTQHAGQISFPGGRREEGDGNPVETALRETQEELGIAPQAVEILGRMDPYETRTGFLVTPVIGLLGADVAVTPDRREVEEVFEVPLAFLLNPLHHQRHSVVRDGRTYHFHAMPYRDYYIWGATAGMLINFYRELAG